MSSAAKPASGRLAALSEHTALIAFVLFVLMAGSNPVAIRFSNSELPPFWGGAARLGAAAVIMWAVVLIGRVALPRGRALLGVVLYGLLGFGALNALAFWVIVRVPPGLTSVFLALVPLATVIVAAAHGLEPLTRRKVAGAVIGAAGIALIVGAGLGPGVSILVLLALIAIPFALAESFVLIKLYKPGSPMSTNAVGLTAGAAMLAVLSLLAGETWRLPGSPATWAAFGYLVVIGSVMVFYLWLVVLARWPASRSAYGFVLMPAVTVVVSASLTGEVITAFFVLGAAVALIGVWLGAISAPPLPAAPLPTVIEEGNACMPTC